MKLTLRTVNLTGDRIGRLRSLIRGNRKFMGLIGRALEVVLRRHFQAKNDAGNKRGWWRSYWWSREVMGNTSLGTVTDTEAEVGIASREFLQRLKGGTIKPKAGRFLAIPLRSEAKQAGSPAEWTTRGDGQLIAIRTARGVYLFRNFGYRGRGIKGQSLQLWYKLAASVRQLPDPTALPTDESVIAALDAEVEANFGDLLAKL